MTISPKNLDAAGNQVTLDGICMAYDAMTNAVTPVATRACVVAGTGTPTFTAAKGTLYTNLTGSSTSTRLYVNTDGATTWTNFTSAA